jgi:integrase
MLHRNILHFAFTFWDHLKTDRHKHLPNEVMKNLNYQLKNLCSRNKDGSYSTQSNRHRILQQAANQLHDMGFRQMNASSLKPKHVEALVERWKEEKLTNGVIKNRMAHVRWWSEKIDRRDVVAKDNAHYGIENRQYVTNESKAVSVESKQLDQVKDHNVQASLKLQQAFGLRREEAIKFNADYADKGDHIQLKGSWAKGGKERIVPIRNEEQRTVLNEVKILSGKGSLIPPDKSYIQQLRIYERHTSRNGLNKLHGLRHQYAQQRYEEITGWKSPAEDGPSKKFMTEEQKEQDLQARLTISKELGHEREQITAVYLGR